LVKSLIEGTKKGVVDAPPPFAPRALKGAASDPLAQNRQGGKGMTARVTGARGLFPPRSRAPPSLAVREPKGRLPEWWAGAGCSEFRRWHRCRAYVRSSRYGARKIWTPAWTATLTVSMR
jgi:hypothetical protein